MQQLRPSCESTTCHHGRQALLPEEGLNLCMKSRDCFKEKGDSTDWGNEITYYKPYKQVRLVLVVIMHQVHTFTNQPHSFLPWFTYVTSSTHTLQW
jgi:hypothetical protein